MATRRLRAALLTSPAPVHVALRSANGKWLRAALLATTALAAIGTPAAAQDMTWLANPGSGDFFDARNWSLGSTSTGTHFFDTSATTTLTLGTNATFGGWTFNAGASNYIFSISNASFAGAGITINGGSATIYALGQLTFANASTAGGATIDNRVFLYFINASTAGTATIKNNFGRTDFFDSSTAGSATITNMGSVYFSGSSTAGNAQLINDPYGIYGLSATFDFSGTSGPNGDRKVSAGSIAGWGTFSLGANELTVGSNNLSTEVNGVIADGDCCGGGGTGASLVKVGTGTLTLSGDNTYTGGTTINGGTLQIGNGGTTGSVLGNIVDNAALIFNRSDNIVYSGVISGNGTLEKLAAGTLTLTGDNTYTGGTTINGGTLQIGNGGTAGSVVGNIVNNAALIFNRSDSISYSGVISGSGTLEKLAAGTLTLSGISTYTGATVVDDGKLVVNGSIAASSSLTMNSGTTLGGNGIVGDTNINGGTLAPGNSIGLLTVQGNLVLSSASRYMVEVSPVNADRVDVTGTANLGGATVNASFAAGSYVSKRYTIVNATGGLGGTTFGAFATTNLPDTFKSKLSYDSNNAYLDLELIFVPPATTGAGGNQQGVGNALVNYFNRNGGIPLVYGGLTQAGLTQASGETATGGQQTAVNAVTQFMGSMTDTFAAGRGGSAPGAMGFADDGNAGASAPSKSQAARDAYAMFTKAPLANSYDPRWSVWASGFGGSQTTDGNSAAGSNTSSSNIYGVAAGADYRLSPATIAGFAMAGGATNFSVTGGGSGHSDLFQIGGFVRHAIGATYLSGALAYGWQDVTTNRTVISDQLQARFNANTFSGRFEAGHRVTTSWLGGLGLTPYAAAQVTAIALPSYAETVLSGSNAFALSYAGKTVTDTRSELGLRSDKSFALDGALLTLRGRAAWAHDFNTDRAASATFLALPGASFVVNGAAAAHDAALTTASAEVSFLNGISFGATFEGEFSDVTRSYAGKGVARYTW